jgi:serine/threonine-protein kinase
METIGRYQIIEEIGRGGMGTVYRASDTVLGREIALKLLSRHLSDDHAFAERFRREAQIIAQLEHPHIVPIYDFGVHENQPFLVMRLLMNGTLRTRIEEHPFAPDALWPIMQQVASAIDLAHTQQIVHRDIKPTNILFDSQGSAFVSDFGIAKVLGSSTQLTGSALIGSPAYMSPEQFASDEIDGRADQYSLAIVIYEALTGRLPFTGDTARVMFQHLQNQPPPIHQMTSLPPQATAVLYRALDKDPDSRFHTVTEFIQAMAATSHLAPNEPLPETHSTTIIKLDELPPRPAPTRTPPPPEPTRTSTDHFRAPQPAESAVRSTRPPVVKGAGGVQKEEVPLWQRPFVWASALVLVALIAAAIFIFWPKSETADQLTTTEEVTTDVEAVATDSEAAPEIVMLAIVPGPGGLDWQSGTDSGRLTAAGDVPFTAGQPLLLQNGAGVTAVTLPDQTQLFLDNNTILSIQTIVGMAAAAETALQVEAGMLLAAANGQQVDINTKTGDSAMVEAGSLLAVSHRETPFWFQADCLTGRCTFAPQGDEAMNLTAGEAVCIFGESCQVSGVITTIDYGAYGRFSSLVPAPTNTPTALPPSPTPSFTPEQPTETATTTPTPTPTATPVSSLQVRITLSSVNLRTGPGTRYPIFGTLQRDDIVTVIAISRDGTWYLIEQDDEETAWLAVSVAEMVTPFDAEDVATAVTIPAPPISTATPTFTPQPGGGSSGGGSSGGGGGGGGGTTTPPTKTPAPAEATNTPAPP